MKNLINTAKERISWVIYESRLIGTRFTLALAELIWAISLLWEGDTFTRTTYYNMSLVMPENTWGMLFLLTAAIQWFLLLSRNFSSTFSLVFAGVNATMWIYVCVSMYMSVYPPPAAISGELALAFAASWVFLRTGINNHSKAVIELDSHDKV